MISRNLRIFLLSVMFLFAAAVLPSAQATSASELFQEGTLNVKVDVRVDQVVSINQKSENFTVVANIILDWQDDKLAFDEKEYGRDYKFLQRQDFERLADQALALKPAFVISNQQSQRWQQQALVWIEPNGQTTYYERATITLQAPYFDFRKFPFDTQKFFVEVSSVLPSEVVRFLPGSKGSGLGDMLGEEAWIIENPEVTSSQVSGISGRPSDQISLGFTGRRHIEYYALRIFLPMIILILVSWMTFFLDEYRRRIEITSANLLAFIIFNFAISDKLPELGYLTFLDFVLQWMFIFTGAVIILNVGLTRLVNSGREALAHRIDTYVVKWVYPLGYATVVGVAMLQFLIRPTIAG